MAKCVSLNIFLYFVSKNLHVYVCIHPYIIYVIEQEQILIHVQFLNAIITVIAFFFEVIAK